MERLALNNKSFIKYTLVILFLLRGTYNYKRTSSELIKRFPNLKSIFDIMHKEYEKRYK